MILYMSIFLSIKVYILINALWESYIYSPHEKNDICTLGIISVLNFKQFGGLYFAALLVPSDSSFAAFILSTYSSKMSLNRDQDLSGMVIAVRKLVFT